MPSDGIPIAHCGDCEAYTLVECIDATMAVGSIPAVVRLDCGHTHPVEVVDDA